MTFTIAHLSDAHIGPVPRPTLRQLAGKRGLGYVNWRRGRSRTHDMELLARLVADINAQKRDHVAMTGDILNIGLPAEFPAAAAWLATLGTPLDVSFTPGNHDAYTRDAMPHLAATFAPWVAGDATCEPAFPYLRVRGGVCGLMTTVGGLGHALPYLVPDSWHNAFWIATGIASVVVFLELWAIAYIRTRFMDTPFLQAAFQVVIGGVLVLLAGILIGGA